MLSAQVPGTRARINASVIVRLSLTERAIAPADQGTSDHDCIRASIARQA
jgi:hypothetical protein